MSHGKQAEPQAAPLAGHAHHASRSSRRRPERSAEAITDRLFEALSHFADEAPALQTLRRCLTSDARIVVWRGSKSTFHHREEWLEHVARATWERQRRREGFFVSPQRRFVLECSEESICQARLELVTTLGGALVARDAVTCSATLRPTGAAGLQITRLTLVYEEVA